MSAKEAPCASAWEDVSRPGSQDNVRVDRPEHKALFPYRKRLEVPDPFNGSERGQERCLKRQELQLDWVQWFKGAPLKSSQDNREVPRGHKGTMRSCFPRDRPSTASWWAAIAATYTFKVEGDSLRSNLSWRKESTTPIVHLRGSSGARRTPGREQTPFQCVGLPCWRSSSLNDGFYHRRW